MAKRIQYGQVNSSASRTDAVECFWYLLTPRVVVLDEIITAVNCILTSIH